MISLALSCKSKAPETSIEPSIPDAFYTFYDQFHQDSAFQMDHIIFPLSGEPAYDSLRSEDFVWEKKDWVMHRPFDDNNGTFDRQWYDVNSVIIEKISDSSGRFTMERRWAKMGGDWALIYYKEMGM
jgi:hypothetical protein